MALGKRSGVMASKEQKLVGDTIGAADQDAVIGDDGGPVMKKFAQHIGAAPHDGQVMHAGERLQGNIGDNPHYADQPDSA